MGKRLFLLLMSAAATIVMSPRILIATDEIVVQQPDFHAVETIEQVEPVELVIEKPLAIAQTTVPIKQPVNYTVTIYATEMVAHGLSYSDIYKTGKLIYAHNSDNLFGNLKYLGYGEVFYVTEPTGVTAYQVVSRAIYNKTSDEFLDNDPYLMGKLVYTANGYDIAMMTCEGSYGNGDAPQRLVVFANKY